MLRPERPPSAAQKSIRRTTDFCLCLGWNGHRPAPVAPPKSATRSPTGHRKNVSIFVGAIRFPVTVSPSSDFPTHVHRTSPVAEAWPAWLCVRYANCPSTLAERVQLGTSRTTAKPDFIGIFCTALVPVMPFAALSISRRRVRVVRPCSAVPLEICCTVIRAPSS